MNLYIAPIDHSNVHNYAHLQQKGKQQKKNRTKPIAEIYENKIKIDIPCAIKLRSKERERWKKRQIDRPRQNLLCEQSTRVNESSFFIDFNRKSEWCEACYVGYWIDNKWDVKSKVIYYFISHWIVMYVVS